MLFWNCYTSLGATINQTGLPQQNEVQTYILNLINSYNSLIKYHEVKDNNFENNKRYFSLYREEGHSFEVICVKADIKDDNFINCIFVPISSNSPIIIVDFKHELDDYFPTVLFKASQSTIRGGLFSFSDTILYADYILALESSDVSHNTLKNSKELAEYFYQNDKRKIVINKINETWGRFKDENNGIIWGYENLSQKTYEIDNKIRLDESYTYELFLIDFKQINRSVTHYKELPAMIESLKNFVNSDLIKDYVNYSNKEDLMEIDNKVGEIINNIKSNETYLLIHLTSDLQELNQKIEIELNSNWKYLVKKNWGWGLILVIIPVIWGIITWYFGSGKELFEFIKNKVNKLNLQGLKTYIWSIIRYCKKLYTKIIK